MPDVDNYINGTVFKPNKEGQKYSGLYTDDTKAFPDTIEDLIMDGIISAYANTDLEAEDIDSVYKYGSGGPSALSKM